MCSCQAHTESQYLNKQRVISDVTLYPLILDNALLSLQKLKVDEVLQVLTRGPLFRTALNKIFFEFETLCDFEHPCFPCLVTKRG